MDPQLDQIIESLLFASPEPIESKAIARLVRSVAKRQDAEAAESQEDDDSDLSEYEDDPGPDGESKEHSEEEGEAPDSEGEDEIEEDLKEDGDGEVEEPEAASIDSEEVSAEDDTDDEGSTSEEQSEQTSEVNLIKVSAAQVDTAIEKLNDYYKNTGRAFAVVARPNGWKLYSCPEFSPWLRELFPVKRSARLSPPALETLAIIAYRQPLTRAAIEAVRGVAVDGVVNTLVERGLIHIAGRAELPGRPLLYETTPLFFEHFNIRNIDDLPNAAELRQVKLPEPESEAGEEESGEEQEELDLADDAKESDEDPDASEEETEEQLEIPVNDEDE